MRISAGTLAVLSAIFLAFPLATNALSPQASCVIVTATLNATFSISTTRASATAPYGYNTSWTIFASGSQVSNNTWDIYEWAPTSTRGCATLGNVYVPNMDANGLLVDNSTFTAGAQLVGPTSILGRGIVVYDTTPSAAPLACCAIMLSSDADPVATPELAPVGTSTSTISCTLNEFNTTAMAVPISVIGTVSISAMSTTVLGYDEIGLQAPPYHWGSRFTVTITDSNATMPLDFHVHEYPSVVGACEDFATGGHYNPGDGLNIIDATVQMGLAELSNKHGKLALPFNNTAAIKTFTDHGVRLDGSFGIAGRSIVIHSNENGSNAERVACCTLPFLAAPVPFYGPTDDIEAICELPPGLDVSGTFYFRQPSAAGQMGVQIIANFSFGSPLQQGGFHDWRIHTTGSGTNFQAGECELSGPPYTPPWENLGPDVNNYVTGQFYSGNLGFKHDFLSGSQSGEVVFNDGGLALSGPKSVIGRSLRIYSVPGPTGTTTLGCCNILRVPPGTIRSNPRIATCDFGSSGSVTGTITLTQNNGAEGTALTYALNGPGVAGVAGLSINTFAVTGSSCNSVGANFEPVTGYSDVTSRIGPVTGSGTKTDMLLRLSGANSILGRSLALTNSSGGRVACCTVTLTGGSDADVRYSYSGAEAMCSFSDDLFNSTLQPDGVEGWIKFRQLMSPDAPYVNLGTEIEVNIIGQLLGSFGLKALKVMNQTRINSCSDTGSLYEPDDGLSAIKLYSLGRLGAKHGNFSGDRYLTRFVDNAISLYGPNSVAGRSVLIEDDKGNPVICCNIDKTPKTHPSAVPPPSGRPAQKAVCELNHTMIKGAIIIDDDGTNVRVSSITKGIYMEGTQTGPHNYHIHLYGTTNVANVGGHYRPNDGIGPDSNGVKFSTTGIVELGDLSGKHGPMKLGEYFTYIDNEIQLGGPYSVLGRSIVVHDAISPYGPFTSCVIKAVDRTNYFPISPWPQLIKQCSSASTFGSFVCQGGTYTSSTNIIIGPSVSTTWEGFTFLVNGGITIRFNSTLTVQNAELTVSQFITLNDGAVLNLKIVAGTSAARFDNFKTYGGVMNVVGSTVSIATDWDESICKSLLTPTGPINGSIATPMGSTVISLPVPITMINDKTNVSMGGVFSPCGQLQIDLSGGAYTSPFIPFTYSSIAGRFTKISYFNSGGKACEKFLVTPTYNSTKMIVTVEKDASACQATETNLYIIIGIVVAAVVVAIIIAIIVIAVTPAGIPCRIWYRRTCGAKFSQSGRNTQGF